MCKVNVQSPNTRGCGIPWRQKHRKYFAQNMLNTCYVEAENGTVVFHDSVGGLGFVSVKAVMIFSWWCIESLATWSPCTHHVLKQARHSVLCRRNKWFGYTLWHFPNRKGSICDCTGNKYIFPVNYTRFSSLKLSWSIFTLWSRAVRTEDLPESQTCADRAPSWAEECGILSRAGYSRSYL